MSIGRSKFASIARGTATLSAVAILMGAGFITPANAAEGVPFDPTVTASVKPNSALGSTIPVTVTLGAEAGDEWTDVNGEKAPVTVRIEAYGSYADGAVPAQSALAPASESPATTQTFPATGGPGEYVFALSNFDYNAGNYTYVVSVLSFDGQNSTYTTSDVRTPFAAPETTTKVAAAPTNNSAVTSILDGTQVRVGNKTTSTLQLSGFANESIDIDSVLYGPFSAAPVESETPPADAPVASTTTFSSADASTVAEVVADATLEAPGFYVWYHSVSTASDQTAFRSTFGAAGTVVEATSAPAGGRPPVTTPTTPADGSGDGAGDGTDTDSGTTAPPASNNAPATGAGVSASASSTGFANCTAARAAGASNIPASSPNYALKLDSDKDGIGCESNGEDSAVGIDGGFAQASATDNTPFIAGGVAMVLMALGLGATAFFRRQSTVK